jgi:hypothetical protein
MTNQKRLSQISLAAVALLAAALPCLAQTELNNRRNAIDKVQGTEIATLRSERLGIKAEAKTTPAESVNAKAINASRDRFNLAITEATSSTSAFGSKTTFTESDWQKTQKLSNQTESQSSKSIAFVPSRGQKLPD